MVLTQISVSEAMAVLVDISLKVGLYAAVALFCIAILDYMYQKYRF